MADPCLPEPCPEDLREILTETAQRIAVLWQRRREAGISAQARMQPEVRAALPEAGSPLEGLPQRLDELLAGALPCGSDPLDFAHIPSSGNPAALIADSFAAAANLQSASARLAPLAVSLERLVLDWLADFLGYGSPSGGLLTSGSSLANLTALAAARDAALPRARERGLASQPSGRLYASRDVHACISRAARLLGLGESGLVDVSDSNPDFIDPPRLARAIRADRAAGHVPVAVVATVGTTATGAIDPLTEIHPIANGEGIWLHVDGAYGAPAAAIDPALAAAMARADSLALDLHKWLFLPYEAGVLLVRDPARLAASFDFTADYLELAHQGRDNPDPMQLGPELSRGLRALRVWATFHWAGAQRLKQAIRRHIALAERLYGALSGSALLEPIQTPGLSVVCLRLRDSTALDGAEADRRHLECIRLLANGEPSFRLSSIRRDGRLVLRACFVNPLTETDHIDALIARLEAIAHSVMSVTRS